MSLREVNRRRYDRERQDRPERLWYKSPKWFRIRRNQLKAEPSCRMHREEFGQLVPATIVDHVNPHRGNWLAFWGGPFQSLCKPCHDRHKQADEGRGFSSATGPDGWPTDSRHPMNREP